ncbi:MAG: hypothetical protein NZM12_02420, partial [Steroidobacteraceae bacterium]|nr:hypothetical protein [Steroidobacteraceae bacterium]MDW8260865.1 cytochrome c peroxidase [Gammaproteobacteria bacterium]
AAGSSDLWQWRLPAGMPRPAVPADNPMSAAKVSLGERLFNETRLSASGSVACATCHLPERAFTDGRSRSPGATGELTERNAMSLVNVAYSISLGWTRPETRELEEQMREPLFNTHPVEMGLAGREREVEAMLASRSDYRQAFRAAFPTAAAPVTIDNAMRAIASYLRTVVYADSPFDRYLYAGRHDAMSAAARRGMALFFSTEVGCAGCHSGIHFAGPWRDADGATGPAAFARNGGAAQPLKVPTLRNVELTAPYMHDGRFATLDEVLQHYSDTASGRAPRPDERLPQAPLSAAQQAELLEFLRSLTDCRFQPPIVPGCRRVDANMAAIRQEPLLRSVR